MWTFCFFVFRLFFIFHRQIIQNFQEQKKKNKFFYQSFTMLWFNQISINFIEKPLKSLFESKDKQNSNRRLKIQVKTLMKRKFFFSIGTNESFIRWLKRLFVSLWQIKTNQSFDFSACFMDFQTGWTSKKKKHFSFYSDDKIHRFTRCRFVGFNRARSINAS